MVRAKTTTRTKIALRANSSSGCIANMVREEYRLSPPLLIRCLVQKWSEPGLTPIGLVIYTGIVKTHRLLLLTPTSLLAPSAPDDPTESRMTIGPKALKDMIDHFPSTKSAKTDPQLTWAFDESEVRVRSLETSVDLKGTCGMRRPNPSLYRYFRAYC